MMEYDCRNAFCTYLKKMVCTIPDRIYKNQTLYSSESVICWKHRADAASILFHNMHLNWNIFKSIFTKSYACIEV